jgi:hypothetical protein
MASLALLLSNRNTAFRMSSKAISFLSLKSIRLVRRFSLRLSVELFSFHGKWKSKQSTGFRSNKTRLKRQNMRRNLMLPLNHRKKTVLVRKMHKWNT